MKYLKIIGLFALFCLSFICTDKVIDVAINQDSIMVNIKEYAKKNNLKPTNATIIDDTITPGNTGKYINEEKSYKAMKKIGYYEPTLFVYETIYPEISIYNNYHKYIIKGNNSYPNISLIYIINNTATIDNIINIMHKYNIPINFFIDSNILNSNIDLIQKLNKYEIYNYGNNGNYSNDNLIITNNIINNKANNKSTFCLFLKKDTKSLNNCANYKMLSIMPKSNNNYLNIKSNLENGSLFLINNSQELPSIIEYILSKGYNIVPLSTIITE